MDLQLSGRRVLVTGASRGIGLAAVQAFLAEGAAVTAVSRNGSPELDATGATFLAADLATPEGPRRMIEEALAADPRLDVLVNNAGGGELPAEAVLDPFGGEDEVWSRLLDLNLYAPVRAIRAAMPALTESRGAVVNVGSESSLRPHSAPLSYSAAKAALNAFSRGLAEKVAAAGIRVNVVTPGGTRTRLLTGEDGVAGKVAAALGADRATIVENLVRENGMITGSLIEPAEIARVIVMLASPTLPNAVGSNWTVHAGSLKQPA
ncbi:NAD(P)-dependent dehydrogenase (short-subunit alcohol dehydrogenase family) [Actinoalloteichus hoggarensis]|uniref:3-oxoacyl-[acyl-carrier-protein] reductase FabG n=1 Tax=Actinoalloteichus hoggarensis TaxID=1470176 RepID=A0A221W3T7_9PSEU|nr:SDR family NAD(P)-dependent oxidoreductase [Actinoalloteichus hoggarensis]ASO20532.1 3-oxoacyl-[acyl-carrier-protein] reductase FabG [Actinoalloteichus hoggarensis]MBB5923572.1 NAD(P)-dependent dehydrogenase (short-subunit alcohol dehydrogenase family) [Actinoalloteichus hoggarensis]